MRVEVDLDPTLTNTPAIQINLSTAVCACVCVRASSKLGYPSSPKLKAENIGEDNLVDVEFHICPPVSCLCRCYSRACLVAIRYY